MGRSRGACEEGGRLLTLALRMIVVDMVGLAFFQRWRLSMGLVDC